MDHGAHARPQEVCGARTRRKGTRRHRRPGPGGRDRHPGTPARHRHTLRHDRTRQVGQPRGRRRHVVGKDRIVRDVWVGGVRHVVKAREDLGLDGAWAWTAGFPGEPGSTDVALHIDGNKLTCELGDVKLKVTNVKRQPNTLTCQLSGTGIGQGTFWLRLRVEGKGLAGVCTTPDGRALQVTATRKPDEETSEEATKPEPAKEPVALPVPLGGYGLAELPSQRDFAITARRSGRVTAAARSRTARSTCTPARSNTPARSQDMPDLPPNGVRSHHRRQVGKHVTPGIIDCHSHTGISRGVNESGQAVTSRSSRAGRASIPDDVNWYRQLAGGVTAVNQLHGSANVIGGQSQHRQGPLRRRAEPERHVLHRLGMPGIKFALGENPRRVNRRSSNRTRVTPTRVWASKVLLRDRFAAAADYAREHAEPTRQLAPRRPRTRCLPPRVDLELAGDRRGARQASAGSTATATARTKSSCCAGWHEEYGIKIGTFQHVLEGYKVADAIKRQRRSAPRRSPTGGPTSSRSTTAIPDNGAILHEVGVNVSFNSDSNEHARRLNTEAGKAVKYGGVARTTKRSALRDPKPGDAARSIRQAPAR